VTPSVTAPGDTNLSNEVIELCDAICSIHGLVTFKCKTTQYRHSD